MMTIVDGTSSQMSLDPWNTIYYVSGTLLGRGDESNQNLLLKRKLRMNYTEHF